MPSEGTPYALFAYAALLPWTFFSTSVTNATNSLVTHTQLITKVYFPREILPATYVIAGLFDFAIGFVVLLGLMAWRAPAGGAFARFLPLPSSTHHYEVLQTSVSLTQIIAIGLAFAITAAVSVFLRVTKLGTAMRAMANDREATAMLGVPVRRVEAAAWFGSGIFCGMAGLLLPDLLTSLDYSALTFLVIASLAAALIGRLQSLWATLFGGLAVGVVRSVLAPMAASDSAFWREISKYREAAPFVLAIIALLYLSRRRVVSISRTTT
jgi:branched-chain amino acid transport system permease protein